ncbi:hypothetical protein HYC85_007417 [Camellia sinensis]|uniref:Uncharacterized protein n=1 Tax=Camellia sinensis TaxID=4442 RepID=A0A7J7HQR9_CAMSI|nr:hypothetical protein HYC85_007417 [Camellia sinensis]
MPYLLWEFSKSMSTNILFAANMASIFEVLKKKYIPTIGIADGMFISIIFCIVAIYEVECNHDECFMANSSIYTLGSHGRDWER